MPRTAVTVGRGHPPLLGTEPGESATNKLSVRCDEPLCGGNVVGSSCCWLTVVVCPRRVLVSVLVRLFRPVPVGGCIRRLSANIETDLMTVGGGLQAKPFCSAMQDTNTTTTTIPRGRSPTGIPRDTSSQEATTDTYQTRPPRRHGLVRYRPTPRVFSAPVKRCQRRDIDHRPSVSNGNTSRKHDRANHRDTMTPFPGCAVRAGKPPRSAPSLDARPRPPSLVTLPTDGWLAAVTSRRSSVLVCLSRPIFPTEQKLELESSGHPSGQGSPSLGQELPELSSHALNGPGP
jgi:hypothetical protein